MTMLIHLLLDLENVQPSGAEIEKVRGARYRLWVHHGPHQKSFTADRVKAWQPLGEQVRFVRSEKAGKNALDLHVVFSIGEASEQDRANGQKACYIVVSKDKGYDAMFGYLAGRNIAVRRAETLPEALHIASKLSGAPESKTPVQPNVSVSAQRVIDHLRENKKNRPTSLKRLRNEIDSHLGNRKSEEEVTRVIDELTALKVLVLNGNKPEYLLKKK